jgi:hypothetical protein
MQFTIQNLGRLEEATIDLGKDLIVLTGPNNTSKSYTAHVIYGFSKYLVSAVSTVLQSALKQETDAYAELDVLAVVTGGLDVACREVARVYASVLPEVLAAPPSFTESAQVGLDFATDEADAARLRLQSTPVYMSELEGRIIINKAAGSGTWTGTRVKGTRSQQELSTHALPNLLVLEAANAFARVVFAGLTDPHIITSERSAIEVFSRELAAKRFGPMEQHESPPYPFAVAEGLKLAQQMALARNTISPYARHAEWLEHEILDGKIDVGPHGETLFTPTGTTQPLDMNLSSSSVKSLASLSFYLQRLARKGDFLIIDEPELSLHPSSQRKVARLLARLVRAGIKVMISTHSDYVIRELNNLIMLSADQTGDLRRKHGYGEDELLRPEQVGAYVFDGAHGRSIPLDQGGIEVRAIDEEVRAQNRASRDIYFSLFEKDDA